MTLTDALIRPLLPDDVEPAARCVIASFGWDVTDQSGVDRLRYRISRLHTAYPDSTFVSESDGVVTGLGQAIRHVAPGQPGVWILSLLGVDPTAQSSGAGRALLRATLATRHPGDRSLIVASDDPRALRAYARIGLAPHPSFQATGLVNRAALPADAGTELAIATEHDDISFVDALTTQVRGAPYGEELRFLLERGGRLLHAGDRGWALLDSHGVGALVAADETTAAALLWRGLAEAPADEPVTLRWITARQQWAIPIVVAAGLKLETHGALYVGGDPGSLAPFLPTGPFA